MNKKIPNIYIAFWIVYYLQGVLYTEGGMLSQSLLVILLLTSLWFFAYANIKLVLPKPMRILSVMIVIWSIYGIIPMIFGVGNVSINVTPFEYIKNIYMSLLPIYAFYVFLKKGSLDENALQKWLLVFVFVAIACFYKQQDKLMIAAAEKGRIEAEFTNNAGYVVLSLLPLLPLYWKKPFMQYVILGVCMLYVLMGYKRGAIVSGVICTLWFFYSTFRNERGKNKKLSSRRLTRLFLTIVIIAAAVYAVQYFMTNSDYFNKRINSTRQGNLSERGVYYAFFLDYFLYNMNALEFLFGLGANGTLKIFHNVAHNDWLEIAIDNGVLMLILYFAYWFSLFKTFFKRDKHNISTIMLGMFIIIYFLKTFISMSYGDIPLFASCALAYALAAYSKPNNQLVAIVNKNAEKADN